MLPRKLLMVENMKNTRPLRPECRCFWHQQVGYTMRGTWTNALSLWRMEVGRNKGLVGSSQLSHIDVTIVCLTTLECALTLVDPGSGW